MGYEQSQVFVNTSSRSLLQSLRTMIRNSLGEGYVVTMAGGDYPYIGIMERGGMECRIRLDGLQADSMADLGARIIRVYLNRPKTLTTEGVLEHVRYFVRDDSDSLQKEPYTSFLDLQMGYVMTSWENENLDIMVTNEMCTMLDIDKPLLDSAARHNTIAAGFEVFPCSPIVLNQDKGENEWMFMVTTREHRFGASVLLFNEPFANLASRVEDDLYVFPSSKYEVMAIPASKSDDVEGLRHVISEINEKYVEQEDQLGYNLYKYDRYRHEFLIA